MCWSEDRDTAIRTAHRLWANSGLPGELAQILPSPQHFAQASQLVTEQDTANATAVGNDPADHIAAIRPYLDVGYDEIYISQMGAHLPDTDAEGFFSFYSETVLPQLRSLTSPAHAK